MRNFEIVVPSGTNLSGADRIVERVCSDAGLTLTMRGSLASYPGCIHWHFKNGKQSGTLEFTLLADAHRLWAKVQRGRRATWIDELLPALKRALEAELRQRTKAPKRTAGRQA